MSDDQDGWPEVRFTRFPPETRHDYDGHGPVHIYGYPGW